MEASARIVTSQLGLGGRGWQGWRATCSPLDRSPTARAVAASRQRLPPAALGVGERQAARWRCLPHAACMLAHKQETPHNAMPLTTWGDLLPAAHALLTPCPISAQLMRGRACCRRHIYHTLPPPLLPQHQPEARPRAATRSPPWASTPPAPAAAPQAGWLRQRRGRGSAGPPSGSVQGQPAASRRQAFL